MFFPSTKSEVQESLEWANAPKAEASTSEVIAESFGSGREMSLSGAVFDYFDAKSAEQDTSEMIPKDQANEMVKDYGISFDADTTKASLNWHIERQENKLRREKILGSVKDNFFKRAVGFGTEMLAAAADPAEVALGGLIGRGVSLGAKSIEATARSMSVAKLAESGGFASHFADAFFGNVASEAIIAATSNTKKEEYTIQQAILNATIGTALISGGLFAAGSMFKTLGKLKSNGLDTLTKTSEGLIEAGKSPSVFIDAVDGAMVKADLMEDPLALMLRKHLPEDADRLVKMSASEAIQEAKKSSFFAQELSESELRQKAWLSDDPQPADFLVKSEIDELNAKLDSPESDFGHDPTLKEFKDSIPEELDDTFDMTKYNEQSMAYKKQLEGSPSAAKEIDNIDLETKELVSEIEAQKGYTNCVKGLFGG